MRESDEGPLEGSTQKAGDGRGTVQRVGEHDGMTGDEYAKCFGAGIICIALSCLWVWEVWSYMDPATWQREVGSMSDSAQRVMAGGTIVIGVIGLALGVIGLLLIVVPRAGKRVVDWVLSFLGI